jgi:hypothetical protein
LRGMFGFIIMFWMEMPDTICLKVGLVHFWLKRGADLSFALPYSNMLYCHISVWIYCLMKSCLNM